MYMTKNIFEIKELRLHILSYLVKPHCIGCKINYTDNYKIKYCYWCGYNLFFKNKHTLQDCRNKI